MVSRQELYELVRSVPMTKLGEKFKLSDSYMARVCATLRVPRPERGYRAKLAVGKSPEKPALPDAQAGDQINWSQGEVLPAPPRARLVALPARPPRGKLPRPVTGTHGLIRDANGNYDTGYKVDGGQRLRLLKRLMVDVTASRASLDKALAFANDLFNALESAGHRVLICSPAKNFTRAHVDVHEQLPKMPTVCISTTVVTFGRRIAPPSFMPVRLHSAWQSLKCPRALSFDMSTGGTFANRTSSIPDRSICGTQLDDD
jgi:hypothetical protein